MFYQGRPYRSLVGLQNHYAELAGDEGGDEVPYSSVIYISGTPQTFCILSFVGKAMCLNNRTKSDLEKRGRVNEDGLGKFRLFVLAMPVSVQIPSLNPIHVPRPKVVPFLTFGDLVQTTCNPRSAWVFCDCRAPYLSRWTHALR
jgi:hypothetical protein